MREKSAELCPIFIASAKKCEPLPGSNGQSRQKCRAPEAFTYHPFFPILIPTIFPRPRSRYFHKFSRRFWFCHFPQSSFLPSEIKRQRRTKILFFVLDDIGGRKLTQAVTGRGEKKESTCSRNPLSVRKTFRPNSHDLVSPRSTAQVREFEIDGADGNLGPKASVMCS